MMKKVFFIIPLLMVLIGCSKDDKEELDQFYINNFESAQNEDIDGIWTIHQAEYNGERININSDFPSCGRNYFVFSLDGGYTEYIYENDNCNPKVASSNWQLSDGIITLTSISSLTDKAAIVSASEEELILKYRYDVDNDGNLDIFRVIARRYDPLTNNHVSKSFKRDMETNDLLRFVWNSFTGPGEFERYEIFRSTIGNCNKDSAELIATVTDISTDEFVDMNPPSTEANICYFLKVYSKDGLTGESAILSENPKNLTISESINLNTPVVNDSNIELSWNPVDIPYFSHYEIVYANSDASNLLFHEEASIVSIEDMGQNSFLNLDPPYLENPFFSVHVYNIFGTRITSNYEGTIFRRKELLGPINLYSIFHDPEDPILYFFGRSKIPDWATYDEEAVFRYNYVTGGVETYTDSNASFGFESTIKIISSPEGKEIISGPEDFYDPITLSKTFSFDSFYLFEQFEVLIPADFTYTKNGFWVIIDSDNLFVFDRNGQELTLIDKQIHFTQHHGDNYYRLININGNQILVGHKEENESILFTINDNGEIIDKTVVDLPLSSDYHHIYRNRNISFYSDSGNFLITQAQRTIYSTNTFEAQDIIPEGFFAIGISSDGNYVFGSKHDPDWLGSDIQTENLKREIAVYDVNSKQLMQIDTQGYPLMVFENNLGELICISVTENPTPVNFAVFVEKFEVP